MGPGFYETAIHDKSNKNKGFTISKTKIKEEINPLGPGTYETYEDRLKGHIYHASISKTAKAPFVNPKECDSPGPGAYEHKKLTKGYEC